MATCSYSEIVGGMCGPSVTNPAHVQCVLMRKCDTKVSPEVFPEVFPEISLGLFSLKGSFGFLY